MGNEIKLSFDDFMVKFHNKTWEEYEKLVEKGLLSKENLDKLFAKFFIEWHNYNASN